MVGRLVDEKKRILLRKENLEHQLALLPLAEPPDGLIQERRIQGKIRHLLQDLPFLSPRLPDGEELRSRLFCIRLRQRIGETVRRDAARDRPLIGELSVQDPKKGGLSLSVPADEPQLPVGVKSDVCVLEDRLLLSLIGKGEVVNLNL